MTESNVESPCIGHCCLDAKDICVGCFRSIEEIMHWRSLDEEEKRDILARAEQRRQARDARR